MTKDLAMLAFGNDVKESQYMFTEDFLDALDRNLKRKVASLGQLLKLVFFGQLQLFYYLCKTNSSSPEPLAISADLLRWLIADVNLFHCTYIRPN